MIDMYVKLIVVGCGGTGGDYIASMGRYLYSLPQTERSRISLILVDGDTVEEKNIARQPFIDDDIGMNKAVALGDALRDVYGLSVLAYPRYLESVEDLNQLTTQSGSNTLVVLIGCVDNHNARKIMDEFFHSYGGSMVYLDSANEFCGGEMVVSLRNQSTIIAPTRHYYYPDLYDGDMRSARELSCAALNESKPQHLVTNKMAATILLAHTMKVFNSAVEDGGIGCLQGGIVYFDAFRSMQEFVPYKRKGFAYE